MPKTITPDFKNQQLADNVVMREHEVHQYQVNIDNYTHMLARLGDLPELPPDNVDALTKGRIEFRNRLRELIVTEALEQMKSQMVYDALEAQLPPDQAEQLIHDAAARRIAQTNR